MWFGCVAEVSGRGSVWVVFSWLLLCLELLVVGLFIVGGWLECQKWGSENREK